MREKRTYFCYRRRKSSLTLFTGNWSVEGIFRISPAILRILKNHLAQKIDTVFTFSVAFSWSCYCQLSRIWGKVTVTSELIYMKYAKPNVSENSLASLLVPVDGIYYSYESYDMTDIY